MTRDAALGGLHHRGERRCRGRVVVGPCLKADERSECCLEHGPDLVGAAEAVGFHSEQARLEREVRDDRVVPVGVHRVAWPAQGPAFAVCRGHRPLERVETCTDRALLLELVGEAILGEQQRVTVGVLQLRRLGATLIVSRDPRAPDAHQGQAGLWRSQSLRRHRRLAAQALAHGGHHSIGDGGAEETVVDAAEERLTPVVEHPREDGCAQGGGLRPADLVHRLRVLRHREHPFAGIVNRDSTSV
jgi:hypothetical protein